MPYRHVMADTSAASRIFERWLSAEMRPFLAVRGWRKRGSTFLLPAAPNTGLIVFQKSKWNDARTCQFVVEAGVFSPRMARHEVEDFGYEPPVRPTLYVGAIRHRLSSLMGEPEDLWWAIRSPALSYELDALGASVRDKFERFALPYVAAYLTDEAIRDEMLARLDELGPRELHRLRRLIEDLGPEERLADIEARVAPATALAAERLAQALVALEHADDEDAAAADAAMRRLARR
jgi:hypothetical protein